MCRILLVLIMYYHSTMGLVHMAFQVHLNHVHKTEVDMVALV